MLLAAMDRVVQSGYFDFPCIQSQSDGTAIYEVMSRLQATRDRHSPTLKGEKQISKSLSRTGTEPEPLTRHASPLRAILYIAHVRLVPEKTTPKVL